MIGQAQLMQVREQLRVLQESIQRGDGATVTPSAAASSSASAGGSSPAAKPEMNAQHSAALTAIARNVVMEGRYSSKFKGQRSKTIGEVWGLLPEADARELMKEKNAPLLEELMSRFQPPGSCPDVRPAPCELQPPELTSKLVRTRAVGIRASAHNQRGEVRADRRL